MNAALPIIATTLHVAYAEAEDRISLLAWDAERRGVHVALTRRLTGRVVNGLAHLLEQSSPLASTAPADLRDDIILLEHQDALYGDAQAAPKAEPPAGEGTTLNVPAPRLLEAIDVTLTPQTFELLLRDGQSPLIRLSLTRLEMHRVVEALSQRAQGAAWNITVESAWLEPGQTNIVFN
ncbi:hypothetical protein [Methylobacterium soli]|uniref:Uncharacterized protein n=1 Tax=Methylobacterium soli TaxID=553447 RepID=A0A6L3T3W3_9HYPH|nr:hypothetical protein [Methylobacterium soli]KAB1079671.1 hypothetical protein F6X53_10350 [Methylobacterium soli]GJE43734.1 hypothetical protein AEGHOMDF_2913 [Methylobacterium soli]